MWNPLKIFFADKPDENLTKDELIVQRGRVSGSYYQEYFTKKPTLSDIYEMRQDPTIKIGLSVIKHPLQRVDWDITNRRSDEPLPSDIKHLVEDNIRGFWDEFMVNVLTAIEFGYAIQEKVWKTTNSYLVYDRMVPLRPDSIQIFYNTSTGYLTRIKQAVSYPKKQSDKTAQEKKNEKEGIWIPAEKLFTYSHNKQFANVEGESRLIGIYPYWKMCDDIYRYANAYYYRYSIPLVRGWAPPGDSVVGKDEKGNEIRQDNLSWWASILEDIHKRTVIVHQYTANNEFGLEFIEPKTKGITFLPYIEHLNIMKLVALFVPELTVMKGVRGSYGLGSAQTELFLDNEEAILKELNGRIDMDLIKPLVDMNFSPTYTGREAPQAHWSYAPISKQVRGYISKVFELITNALGNRGITQVDIKEIAERLGIPVLDKPVNYIAEGATEDAEMGTIPGGTPDEEKEESEEIESSEVGLAELTIRQQRAKINKMADKLSKEMKSIYDTQIEAILIKTKEILEKNRDMVGSLIRKMRVLGEGKLSSLLYANTLNAFDEGKRSASSELKVDYDPKVPSRFRNSLRARADAIAARHASDLLYLTELTVDDNLHKNVTNKDIITMLIDEFEKFESKRLGTVATTELFNAFGLGRGYLAEQYIIK